MQSLLVDLKRALQIFAHPSPPELLAQANSFLCNLQNNSGLFLLLVEILNPPISAALAVQTLILLKNTIRLRWNSKAMNKQRLAQNQRQKPFVRTKLLKLISDLPIQLHKFVYQALLVIAKFQFPMQFQELFVQIQKACMRLDSLQPTCLRFIEKLMKNHSIKRKDWSMIQKLLEPAFNYLKVESTPTLLTRRCSKIILYGLYSLDKSKQNDIKLQAHVALLYRRLNYLVFQFSGHSQQQVKEIKALIYINSGLQSALPLLYAPFLEQHIRLMEQCIYLRAEERKQKLIRVGLLSLIKLLNNFFYNSEKNNFVLGVKMDENNINLHQQVYKFVQAYFQSTMPALLPYLIQTHIVNPEVNYDEDQEGALQSLFNPQHQTDNTTSNVVLLLLSNLINRKPELAFRCLKLMFNQIHSVTSQIQVNLLSFSLMFNQTCYFKQIYRDLLTLTCNLAGLKGYLCQVLRYSYKYMQQQQLLQYLRVLSLELNNLDLSTTKTFKVLKIYLFSKEKISKEKIHLLDQFVLPVFNLVWNKVPLLSKDNPSTLWGFVTLVTKYLSQCKNQRLFQITTSHPGFISLFSHDSPMVLQVLAELLTRVYETNTFASVQTAILTLIQCKIELQQCQRLWLLVLCKSPRLPQLKERLVVLLNRIQDLLLHKQLGQHLIAVLEQYILTGLSKPAFYQLTQLLCNIYIKLKSLKRDSQPLLVQFMSLVLTTFILYSPLQSAQLVQIVLKQGLSLQTNIDRERAGVKSHSLLIVSSLIILDKNEFFKQVRQENFMELWLSNLDHITSGSVFKLNLIAFFLSLQYLQQAVFFKHSELILTSIISEINKEKCLISQEHGRVIHGHPFGLRKKTLIQERFKQLRVKQFCETMFVPYMQRMQGIKMLQKAKCIEQLLRE